MKEIDNNIRILKKNIMYCNEDYVKTVFMLYYSIFMSFFWYCVLIVIWIFCKGVVAENGWRHWRVMYLGETFRCNW